MVRRRRLANGLTQTRNTEIKKRAKPCERKVEPNAIDDAASHAHPSRERVLIRATFVTTEGYSRSKATESHVFRNIARASRLTMTRSSRGRRKTRLTLESS